MSRRHAGRRGTRLAGRRRWSDGSCVGLRHRGRVDRGRPRARPGRHHVHQRRRHHPRRAVLHRHVRAPDLPGPRPCGRFVRRDAADHGDRSCRCDRRLRAQRHRLDPPRLADRQPHRPGHPRTGRPGHRREQGHPAVRPATGRGHSRRTAAGGPHRVGGAELRELRGPREAVAGPDQWRGGRRDHVRPVPACRPPSPATAARSRLSTAGSTSASRLRSVRAHLPAPTSTWSRSARDAAG